MQVRDNPARYVDDDGAPITEIELENSRFDVVAVKQLEDGIEIRAHDTATDDVVTLNGSLTEELYRGIEIEEHARRRDVDDDIQDLVQIVGYTIIDPAI